MKPFLFSAVSLLLPALCSAQSTPAEVAAELVSRARTGSDAMALIGSLTTDVGPRQAGSENEKRAAAWAQQRFKELGADRVWVETFSLTNGWARGIERAEVLSPALQPLAVTALGGSTATPPEGLVAEIALFTNYDGLLAAPAGSLAKKIAVVTQPMPRRRDGSGYHATGKIRSSGPAEASRRGAIAYLCRSLATDNHRLPHTGQTDYRDATRIPAAALSVPDALLLERLAAEGAPVRIKLVLTPHDLGPVTSQNVTAEFKGRERPEEIVVLGAHLDSWDLGTGALDDGVGVAIVMAAAKLVRELPHPPRRTIRVVLFGAEEPGLLGGAAYAQAHHSELSHYVLVAEPDEGQGPVYRLRTGVANTNEPSLKAIVAALAPLGISLGDNHTLGDSDVRYLARGGVPTVALDLDGTDYFDFHHTADDTLDKISPERIGQTTAAYAVLAYLAAELGGDYRAP